MIAVAVDKRRDRRQAYHIETPSNQREPLFGKINNPWRFMDAPAEPRLDGVPVRGDNVRRLWRHQRADVGGDDGIALGICLLRRECDPGRAARNHGRDGD